jgi:hypothetical protein
VVLLCLFALAPASPLIAPAGKQSCLLRFDPFSGNNFCVFYFLWSYVEPYLTLPSPSLAFCYYLFCAPMLRWTMIFLYRPKFDIGGGRFPFIFDMCVSGMIVGQILLVTMMSLLRAAGPALMAGLPIIPTIVYRYILRRRFLRAFSDVALLQSSLLVSLALGM